MDGGEDGGDFVLLDRQQRRVINVMRDSKLAMVFVARQAAAQAGWLEGETRHAPAGRGLQRFSLT